MPRITETLKSNVEVAESLMKDGADGAAANILALTNARTMIEIAETLNEIKLHLSKLNTPETKTTTRKKAS